jgi:hypothetical protein
MRVGCFGKPPLAMMLSAQENAKVEKVWVDAGPIGRNEVLSIDSVRIARRNVSESVRRGLLHCVNDVYAAGATPKAFAISYALTGSPDIAWLAELNSNIEEVARFCRCRIAKRHTSFGSPFATMTVAVVGLAYKQHRKEESGIVFLAGSIDFAKMRKQKLDNKRCKKEIEIRKFIVQRGSALMKDVSGDGLAGALWQLSIRENANVCVLDSAIASLAPEAAIDDCSIDRNYADYADKIEGYDGKNTRLLRRALFRSAFFGPLVGLCPDAVATQTRGMDFKILGTYSSGNSRLRIV